LLRGGIVLEKAEHMCFCPLEGVIDVISKKWALLIVNALGNYGVLRFKELEGRLRGVSPKTLSDTLSKLQSIGLIDRVAYNEIPPRVEYRLSDEGGRFRESITPLIRWAAEREGWNSHCCPSTCQMHPSGSGCGCKG
jgi:DNA-binding HxlR family transcriptional regulator